MVFAYYDIFTPLHFTPVTFISKNYCLTILKCACRSVFIQYVIFTEYMCCLSQLQRCKKAMKQKKGRVVSVPVKRDWGIKTKFLPQWKHYSTWDYYSCTEGGKNALICFTRGYKKLIASVKQSTLATQQARHLGRLILPRWPSQMFSVAVASCYAGWMDVILYFCLQHAGAREMCCSEACHDTNISVIDTDTSEFPQFLILISYHDNNKRIEHVLINTLYLIMEVLHIKLSSVHQAWGLVAFACQTKRTRVWL